MNMTTELNLTPIAVGRYTDKDGEAVPLPYSIEEVERARRAITRILSTFHFRTGSNVLLTSQFHEGAQFMPVERAIMSYGMVAVSADSHLYDARRVESITRGFSLAAAIGISPETLTGLEQQGHQPEEMFANMVIWARPGAYEQLKQFPQLDVYRVLDVGPTIAMECSSGNGAHIDRFEWLIDEQDGEIVLSNRLSRSTPFTHYHTGLKGRVVEGACSCGNADPRIQLTD